MDRDVTHHQHHEQREIDSQHMGWWLQRLQPDLRRIARAMAKNASDGADLLQATCLRALEKRRKFAHGSPSDLRNWLIKIMRNLHLDGLRRRATEVLIDDPDDVAAAEPAPVPRWKTVDEGALWSAIGRLSPSLREVYQLVAIERCRHAAIARRLGISGATVATRLYRARACIREFLAASPPASLPLDGRRAAVGRGPRPPRDPAPASARGAPGIRRSETLTAA